MKYPLICSLYYKFKIFSDRLMVISDRLMNQNILKVQKFEPSCRIPVQNFEPFMAPLIYHLVFIKNEVD